jgi:hypothetical protein
MSTSDGFSERPPLVDQLAEVQDFREREEPKQTKVSSSARRNQVYKGTKVVYLTVGKVVAPFNGPIGESIQVGAGDAAEAWDELASQNPKVKAFILNLIQGTVWAKLISVHLQMALPFLATSESLPVKMREMAQSLLMMQMAEQMQRMQDG